MELVKLFMLKHTDAEPVIINNITFAAEQATAAQQALGPALVEHLEVLVRTLLVLQEVGYRHCNVYMLPPCTTVVLRMHHFRQVNWSQAGTAKEIVHWRESALENYVSPFVAPLPTENSDRN